MLAARNTLPQRVPQSDPLDSVLRVAGALFLGLYVWGFVHLLVR